MLVVSHYHQDILCKNASIHLNLSKLCPKYCRSFFPRHGATLALWRGPSVCLSSVVRDVRAAYSQGWTISQYFWTF